jgi:hypothetical protein
MFEVLEADGFAFEALDPSKPNRCARSIFISLLAHVQQHAPESALLRATVAPLSSPAHIQKGRILSINDALIRSSKCGRDEVLAIPDRLLTLAFAPENFYSALMYTMEAYAADPSKSEKQMKETLEALIYRLAIKDPVAFPRVFSVIGGST